MTVDCWSFRAESQDTDRLPVIPGSGGFREFASLGHASGITRPFPLPAKLLIQGKVTFRRTNAALNGLPLQPIQTLLLDLRLPDQRLDDSWFSLAKNDADTATISVLATVDAPSPDPNDPLSPHVISWRVNPEFTTFDIHMAWLTAVRLDSRTHHEAQ